MPNVAHDLVIDGFLGIGRDLLDHELRLFQIDGIGAVLALPVLDHVFAKEVGGLKEDVVHGIGAVDKFEIANDNVGQGGRVFLVVGNG